MCCSFMTSEAGNEQEDRTQAPLSASPPLALQQPLGLWAQNKDPSSGPVGADTWARQPGRQLLLSQWSPTGEEAQWENPATLAFSSHPDSPVPQEIQKRQSTPPPPKGTVRRVQVLCIYCCFLNVCVTPHPCVAA